MKEDNNKGARLKVHTGKNEETSNKGEQNYWRKKNNKQNDFQKFKITKGNDYEIIKIHSNIEYIETDRIKRQNLDMSVR